MTWYQLNDSDLITLGVASAVTTLFASVGTYLLTLYLDLSKDLQLTAGQAEQSIEMLKSVANMAWGGWLFCWLIALLSGLWRVSRLTTIKEEHGELPWWKKVLRKR